MSGMDQWLANYFGTGPAAEPQPSAEDAEKTAQAEFFAKTAAQNNINLSELSPSQIEWLWQKTFSKEAEFPPPKAEGKDEKKDDEGKKREDAARKEHEEKKASQARFQENLDTGAFIGKTAAHSYVATLKQLAGEGALDFLKEAGFVDKAKAVGKEYVKGMKGEGIKDSFRAMKNNAGASVHGELAARKDLGKAVGRSAASYGATAAAAGGAAAGAHHATKKKEASMDNFELESANMALEMIAKTASFDVDEATSRINAVLTLGLAESEKVASLTTFEEARERRALEYAEAAGYPVEWAQ